MTQDFAKQLAIIFHEGQFRADGVTPYINHPKEVAKEVTEIGGSENCVCLAWLHDVLEESLEKFENYFQLEHCHSAKHKFYIGMRDKMDMSFVRKLVRLSDNWDTDKFNIETKGKVAYLSELLISSDAEVVLVKLCDMLANIKEGMGKRKSQAKRYYKAIQCLKLAERKDLDERHNTLIERIEKLYGLY